MDAMPTLVVLGLGLIGGSLVRAAADNRIVIGWSPSAETRRAARAEGFTVLDELDATLEKARESDALVVLASPVTAFPELLGRVQALAPTVKLTDVGSVKVSVEEQVASLAPQARYIGSHPMAGTQFSGWKAGSADLFADAPWVTTLTEDSDEETWADVAELALSVRSRVVPSDALAHDGAVARISHLPHLLALALAQVGADGGALALSLAASSFADATRVAGTRPELIRAMCEANGPALVDALDHALGLLGVARGSLASTGSLAKLTAAGHQARGIFEARGSGLAEVTLTGPCLIDQLVSVGAAGGHVSALQRGEGDLSVTAWYPAD